MRTVLIMVIKVKERRKAWGSGQQSLLTLRLQSKLVNFEKCIEGLNVSRNPTHSRMISWPSLALCDAASIFLLEDEPSCASSLSWIRCVRRRPKLGRLSFEKLRLFLDVAAPPTRPAAAAAVAPWHIHESWNTPFSHLGSSWVYSAVLVSSSNLPPYFRYRTVSSRNVITHFFSV